MDGFGYTTNIDLRYRDLDTMGHVNNAIYATFLEQARMDYFRDVIGMSVADVEAVIAHLEIDYHRPITEEDDVTVAMRVTDLGNASITMEHEIRTGEEVAATADVVQVMFDSNAGEPCSIPPEWRDRITTHEGF